MRPRRASGQAKAPPTNLQVGEVVGKVEEVSVAAHEGRDHVLECAGPLVEGFELPQLEKRLKGHRLGMGVGGET